LNYNKKQNKIPKNITFAMAALLYFYGKEVSQHQVALKDDASIIAFFDQVWKDSSVVEVVDKTLTNTALWDQNLTEVPQLKETLTQALTAITSQKTIAEAYQAFNP
jgi:tagaturonate reductase